MDEWQGLDIQRERSGWRIQRNGRTLHLREFPERMHPRLVRLFHLSPPDSFPVGQIHGPQTRVPADREIFVAPIGFAVRCGRESITVATLRDAVNVALGDEQDVTCE